MAGFTQRRGRLVLAAAAVVLLVVLATLAYVRGKPGVATMSTAILSVISGEVLVRTAPGVPPRAGEDGEALRPGAIVQTKAPSGRAVITFVDGSTAELEPDASLGMDELSTGERGELSVRLRQDRGTTWSYVQPQLSPRSHFTVTTPSATAVARGTSFEVAVVAPDADGTVLTKVSVFEGQVDVVAAGQVRPVAAGRVAEVAQGSSPRVPDAASVPPLCLRLATSSPVMLTVTDPEGRAAGQTAVRRISQIPWSIVSGPQEQPQRVDIFSPPSGEWEVGVAPRGEGGDFELVVSAVAGTKTVTPTVLTGSVVPGERLAIGFHLGSDGELDRFGSFVRTTRTRANIAIDRIGATTTAPLPYAKRFASAADSPHGCGS